MPIDYHHLKNRKFEDVSQRYEAKDTILYALGVGMGADPSDAAQLRYVYEKELLALPTMATVLGQPGFWMRAPDTGLGWQHLVHLEQELIMHRPLPASGLVLGKTVVEAVVDLGARGALLCTRSDLFDQASAELLTSTRSTNLCRGNGHFGGGDRLRSTPHRLPLGPPDLCCTLPSFVQSALIYRLSGDDNPLHADKEVAQSAGFQRPILHGLCLFGMVGHASLRVLCAYKPARLKRLWARFSTPLYPGESLRTSFWKQGSGSAAFKCHSVDRDVVVVRHGLVEYSE